MGALIEPLNKLLAMAERFEREIQEDARRVMRKIQEQKEHPVRAYHHMAKNIVDKADTILTYMDKEIEKLEDTLNSYLWVLETKYGPGQIITKTERRRRGSRKLVIYRTPLQDIVLPQEFGEKIIKTRYTLWHLVRIRKRIRELREKMWREAWVTRHYA